MGAVSSFGGKIMLLNKRHCARSVFSSWSVQFSRLLWNQEFQNRVHKSPPLDPDKPRSHRRFIFLDPFIKAGIRFQLLPVTVVAVMVGGGGGGTFIVDYP